MLSHLVIRNFAIIGHLEIPFYGGLTVLTGETGAGKSIIIDALNLLLGGRAATEVIRTDEDEAVVEGIFELAEPHLSRVRELLAGQGVDLEGPELLVRRIVSRSGRNKVFVNGSLSTVAMLADVTTGLVDISGQHEHYSLMRPEKHLSILDNYALNEVLRGRMTEAFAEVRRIRGELAEIRQDVQQRLNRIDFLRFQLDEIDAAKLKEGEVEELTLELDRLRYAERISEATRKSLALCYEDDGSAASRVVEAKELLSRVAQFDPRLQPLAERLEEARILIEDVTHELVGHADEADADPRRLDQVQERLEVIKKLTRKYGGDVESTLAEARSIRQELHRLENAEERGGQLDAELAKAEAAAFQVALELSEKRREAARALGEAIEAELEALNMARTRFVTEFEPAELPGHDEVDTVRLSASGFDEVQFLLAPNAGEAPKALSKIASGGELSRIMLAIKTVLADRDEVSTYIFDEVDTGIGGSTADLVGDKIRQTAGDHQVLCITHLPQIASRGDHHYLVVKELADGRTRSTIQPLSADERVDELARMLGGARVTDKTRDAARELLTVAR